MHENKDNTVKKDRRVLGDEWIDWDGTVEESLVHTQKNLFLCVSALSVVVIIALVFLFSWLIQPRLIELSQTVAQIVNYGVFAFAAIMVLWIIIFIFSLLFNLKLFAPIILVPRVINIILNLTVKIGGLLGIPKDRMINSFLKVYNVALKLKKLQLKPSELLILLPRCLRKDYFEILRNLKERYNFQMFTVGGGQQARQKIKMLMPRAIIAVACERDLLSGFVEVNPKIPVIGLPNNRPEGPCRNTEIDINLIESAVRHLLRLEDKNNQ
jgi:hypothetical protein